MVVRMENVAPLRKPVKCPNCREMSSRQTYPFCSKRCADVDLNRWFSDSYVVPTNEAPESDDGFPQD